MAPCPKAILNSPFDITLVLQLTCFFLIFFFFFFPSRIWCHSLEDNISQEMSFGGDKKISFSVFVIWGFVLRIHCSYPFSLNVFCCVQRDENSFAHILFLKIIFYYWTTSTCLLNQKGDYSYSKDLLLRDFLILKLCTIQVSVMGTRFEVYFEFNTLKVWRRFLWFFWLFILSKNILNK